jgi:catechol 2,3-dioxygenase-like lactoylglutathione lyase family enzyme
MAKATRVRHAGIVVTDLDKALWFYGEMLGFSVQRRMLETGPIIENILALPGVEVETVKLGLDSEVTQLELLRYHSHPTTQTTGNRALNTGPTHVAITVDDLTALHARLTDQGILFNCPPQRSPDGKVLVTYCQDPEGNLVELVEVR